MEFHTINLHSGITQVMHIIVESVNADKYCVRIMSASGKSQRLR